MDTSFAPATTDSLPLLSLLIAMALVFFTAAFLLSAFTRRTKKTAPARRRSGKKGPRIDYGFGVEIGVLGPMPLTLRTAATRAEVYEAALAELDRMEAAGLDADTEVSLRIGPLAYDGTTPMIARNTHKPVLLAAPALRKRVTLYRRNHTTNLAKAKVRASQARHTARQSPPVR